MVGYFVEHKIKRISSQFLSNDFLKKNDMAKKQCM